jgi:hypothetical protein
MERETRVALFFAALALLLLLVIIWYERSARAKRIVIARLKQRYEQAIRDGDKKLSLQLGREYYGMLRGGSLSIYDEQSISNDLSTIVSRDISNGN